jgi:hypothetical protein
MGRTNFYYCYLFLYIYSNEVEVLIFTSSRPIIPARAHLLALLPPPPGSQNGFIQTYLSGFPLFFQHRPCSPLPLEGKLDSLVFGTWILGES